MRGMYLLTNVDEFIIGFVHVPILLLLSYIFLSYKKNYGITPRSYLLIIVIGFSILQLVDRFIVLYIDDLLGFGSLHFDLRHQFPFKLIPFGIYGSEFMGIRDYALTVYWIYVALAFVIDISRNRMLDVVIKIIGLPLLYFAEIVLVLAAMSGGF